MTQLKPYNSFFEARIVNPRVSLTRYADFSNDHPRDGGDVRMLREGADGKHTAIVMRRDPYATSEDTHQWVMDNYNPDDVAILRQLPAWKAKTRLHEGRNFEETGVFQQIHPTDERLFYLKMRKTAPHKMVSDGEGGGVAQYHLDGDLPDHATAFIQHRGRPHGTGTYYVRPE